MCDLKKAEEYSFAAQTSNSMCIFIKGEERRREARREGRCLQEMCEKTDNRFIRQ